MRMVAVWLGLAVCEALKVPRRTLLRTLALAGPVLDVQRAVAGGAAQTLVPSSRIKAPGRVVAIGDVHGDARAFEEVISLAGLYRPSEGWIGGNAVLVQIGDVLDRGDEEAQVLALIRQLKAQAAAAGGRVVTLLGNHEILNACGVTAFVPPSAAGAFGPDRAAAFRPGSPCAAAA